MCTSQAECVTKPTGLLLYQLQAVAAVLPDVRLEVQLGAELLVCASCILCQDAWKVERCLLSNL